MKLVGCVLLLSGFALVVASLVMLPGLGMRFGFVGAGCGVEALGLGLLTEGYRAEVVRGRDEVRGGEA